MKVMYPPLLSSNMSAVAQKLDESLKKQTQFPISFLQSKTPSELEVKFMLKIITFGEKDGANHPPKGPQTRSARGRGR